MVPATSANVAIVGDSQAHSLAINLPDGIDDVFPEVVNGSVDGCSVYDSGSVQSAVEFGNNFSICDGWQDEWAASAAGTDVALVVIGAWDVFDIDDGGTVYAFGTPAADDLFTTNLKRASTRCWREGTHAALLEVACMRPQDARAPGCRRCPNVATTHGSRTSTTCSARPRLVRHRREPRVQFVEGPDEWCTDEAIATDLDYRWDGVHVYKPGAKLIYETRIVAARRVRSWPSAA